MATSLAHAHRVPHTVKPPARCPHCGSTRLIRKGIKDPTDPQWQSTPEYKDWLAWMKKYNSSGSLADVDNVYGYSVTQTMVEVLKACGNDLTRENIMKKAASIHDLKLPMLLPGITVSTGADDYAPIKQMQLERFDGTTWRLFGLRLLDVNGMAVEDTRWA